MNEDGTCDNNGALVGAFILWTCAIDYFGGLFTGLTSQGDTKARFKGFIHKYMGRYDAEKIEDLRWSLQHYYSPHHFVLYHKNNLEINKRLYLTQTNKGILLNLGWAVKDLEEAVQKYHDDLKATDTLKVKLWRYFKAQLPIMPVKFDQIIVPKTFSEVEEAHSITASGTVGPNDWLNGDKS